MFGAAVDQGADPGEHRRRSRQRRFAGFHPFEHFAHIEHALGHREAPVARERQQRIAGNAVQKRGVQAARQQLAVADQQKIGGTGLLHLAVRAKQHLVDLDTLARALNVGPERRGIVAAGLDHAHLRGRTRVLIVDQDAQRLHAAGKIIPNRARKHHQHGLVGRRRRRADVAPWCRTGSAAGTARPGLPARRRGSARSRRAPCRASCAASGSGSTRWRAL